ncbi:MAG: carboxypeptidase-like regulatory domain-containing protein, partial [Bacteroidota bacterium]
MSLRTTVPLLSFLFFSLITYSQQKYTLSGTITEAASNETLIGVTIAVPELSTGVTTNEYGFYSITLPEGEYTLWISYIGFQDRTQKVSLTENQKINFSLTEEVEQLQEVIVSEDVERTNIRTPQTSVVTLSTPTIKKIPVVLGEADV